MLIEAKDDGGGSGNWTTGAISHAKLQSNHHHQQTNIHADDMFDKPQHTDDGDFCNAAGDAEAPVDISQDNDGWEQPKKKCVKRIRRW